jgi:uncharacterized protein YhbP (UPF0306 family)
MHKKPQIPAEILALSTMTLATAGPDGQAHAAAVFFAAEPGLSLYFFSEDHTQHIEDIRENPQAAISIYPQCDDWQDIRGLQMRGAVRPLEQGEEWDAGWELYSKKFPFVVHLKMIVQKNTLYIFTPNWLRLVDNRRGFGYKKEWTIRP